MRLARSSILLFIPLTASSSTSLSFVSRTVIAELVLGDVSVVVEWEINVLLLSSSKLGESLFNIARISEACRIRLEAEAKLAAPEAAPFSISSALCHSSCDKHVHRLPYCAWLNMAECGCAQGFISPIRNGYEANQLESNGVPSPIFRSQYFVLSTLMACSLVQMFSIEVGSFLWCCTMSVNPDSGPKYDKDTLCITWTMSLHFFTLIPKLSSFKMNSHQNKLKQSKCKSHNLFKIYKWST